MSEQTEKATTADGTDELSSGDAQGKEDLIAADWTSEQIEQWKESGKSLDEIKRLLLEKNKEDAKDMDVRQLRKKIKGLEQEIFAK